MNNRSVIRRIDHLGRVVIPKDFRRANCIQDGDPVEISTNEDNDIIIRKHDPHHDLAHHIKYLAEQVDINKYDLEKNKKVLALFNEIIEILDN